MVLGTSRTRLAALAMTFVGLVPGADAKTPKDRDDQQSSQKCSRQGSGKQGRSAR